MVADSQPEGGRRKWILTFLLCNSVTWNTKKIVQDLNIRTQVHFLQYLPRFSSLFNGISIYLGYLMPNPSFLKESRGTIEPIPGRISGGGSYTKRICPKVNVIAWLEFELAYYDSAVQHFNHYTRTPPRFSSLIWQIIIIINSCRSHKPSLSLSWSLLLESLPDGIQGPHRADKYKS